VQQYPLVAVGDLEDRADLLGSASLDVAHRDDGALRPGQVGDRVHGHAERVPFVQNVLRDAFPVRRIGAPVSGEGVAGAAEAPGFDCRLLTLRGEGRVGNAARLANAAGLAMLTTMRMIQVASDDRASKPSSPFSTPSHASCTTSSATARLLTYVRATASIVP
jgi:hypothetical protein